ncbi:MAG TPA: serine hydrolase [Verrucomicrobiae bacterium]|nr:serine hydrolase [Verrucomicrobiae bacterium]
MATAQKAKKQTYESYLSYLPKQRHHRWALFSGIFLIAGIIAAQLALPYGRGLPLATINGENKAFATHDELAKALTDLFSTSKLTLKVGNDKSVTYPLSSAGAVPNTEDMIKTLTDYPVWQRLIPGSLLWQQTHVTEASVYYDKVPLEAFAKARSKELTFPPQNARLAIKAGKLVATPEIIGSDVTAAVLEKTISSAHMSLGKTTTIVVPSTRAPAQRTMLDLAKVRAQAEAVIGRKVTITADTKDFSPDSTTIASWLLLTTDASGNVTLTIDTSKVKQYLATVNAKVGTKAGQTNINLVDGQEASRTTGVSGRAINSDELAKQLASQLLTNNAVHLTARFVAVAPSVIYDHKYTTTQAGLQAYISDASAAQNMHIVVQQLSGEKWYAAAREHESIPSGSTYKLFVAMVLFDRINKGQIHWNDPMLDTDVAGCFDRMTVASTNPCAESWIAQFGRQYINNFIYARGFSTGTTFLAPDATHTTAADLNKYMIGLNNGTLVSGANRDRLLNNLSRHPYKYGIATGSVVASDKVYDKVGFLWDYIHDTAIVTHPRGTYILTIMTKGQSYAAIANVTREIERIMYP